MSHLVRIRSLVLLFVVNLGLLLTAAGRDAGAKGQTGLRFICVSCLGEEQELVLASKDETGQLREIGIVMLRASSVTNWMPAKSGELHLALKDGENLRSLRSFTIPDTIRRALVILTADAGQDTYETNVVDGKTAGFAKGSVLVLNLSPIAGTLQFGKDGHKIEAGRQLVVKPIVEESGMYRLMASRLDAEGKPVMVYDRFVSGKADSRGLVLLLPHKANGLRLFSLPIFGEFD